MKLKYFTQDPNYQLFIYMLIKFRVNKLTPEILELLQDAKEEVLTIVNEIRASNERLNLNHDSYIASIFEQKTALTSNNQALGQLLFDATKVGNGFLESVPNRPIHNIIHLELPYYLLQLVKNIGKKYPSWQNDMDIQPLHLAAIYGDEEVVAGFLKQNADFQAKDWLGRTPAAYAARQGNPEIIKLFLKEDKNLLDKTDNYGNVLSHHCFEKIDNPKKDYVALASLIKDYEIFSSKTNDNNETPLQVLYKTFLPIADHETLNAVVAIIKSKYFVQNQVEAIEASHRKHTRAFVIFMVGLLGFIGALVSLAAFAGNPPVWDIATLILLPLTISGFITTIGAGCFISFCNNPNIKNAIQADEEQIKQVTEKTPLIALTNTDTVVVLDEYIKNALPKRSGQSFFAPVATISTGDTSFNFQKKASDANIILPHPTM